MTKNALSPITIETKLVSCQYIMVLYWHVHYLHFSITFILHGLKGMVCSIMGQKCSFSKITIEVGIMPINYGMHFSNTLIQRLHYMVLRVWCVP